LLNFSVLQISSYLPSLHTDLQKFAVAMEAIVEDEPSRHELNETNKLLIQVLCTFTNDLGCVPSVAPCFR